MNDNKNMLERVLLMMKYDSSKTLTENSDIVKNEFSQILNEKVRFSKPKVKLSAPKAAPRVSAPRVSPTKITASGLSVGQIKSQVATYAKTPLPNGKLPTAAQQIAYGKQLAAGKVSPVTAPGKSAPKSTVTTTTTTTVAGGKTGGGKTGGGKTGGGKGKGSRTQTPKDKSILSKAGSWAKRNPWKVVGGLGLTAAASYPIYQQHIANETLLVETAVQKQVQNKIQEATFFIENPIPAVTLTVKETHMPYHIVAGAFRDEKNAHKTIIQLSNQGFKARCIPKNKYGLYPVIYGSYSTFAQAAKDKKIIQKRFNPDAWILVESL